MSRKELQVLNERNGRFLRTRERLQKTVSLYPIHRMLGLVLLTAHGDRGGGMGSASPAHDIHKGIRAKPVMRICDVCSSGKVSDGHLPTAFYRR